MSGSVPMNGSVVWITGLPSAGKSTLAKRLHTALGDEGRGTCLLDGDAVRGALVPAPGYDEASRDAFYATLAQLAALLAGQGLVAVVAATANRRRYRQRARAAAPHFVEVFVDVPVEVCAERDAKGLYAASREGAVVELPGAGTSYEPPPKPDVVARGGHDERAVARIVALLPRD
jgi:adenylylsulfate kinase